MMPSSVSNVFVDNVTTKHHSELRSFRPVALFMYDYCHRLGCNVTYSDWWDPAKYYHIYQTPCHDTTYTLLSC